MTCMKPSETNSAPVGPTARPRGSLSSAVGPLAGSPSARYGPVAPCAAHDHADVAGADGGAIEGPAAVGRRQQHRLVAAVGHQEVARAHRRSPPLGPRAAPPRSGPPCPALPQTPVPATVKRCPAVIGCPKSVVVAAGSTRTRQLAVSAMKRSPAASTRHPGRLVELARRRRRARPR